MAAKVYNRRMFDYEVRYSNRKTLTISIDESGKVLVRAPYFVKEDCINSLIRNKEAWVLSNLEKMKQLKDEMPSRNYKDLEEFYYLGDVLRLKIIEDAAVLLPYAVINKAEREIIVSVKNKNTELIKKCINDLYKKEAGQIIEKRLSYYRGYINKPYKKVSYRNTKTRWGSCSSKGNLMFDYKIIMAPIEIIDYLVVHELSHLIHLNHSTQFWNLVEGIIPEYRERRMWLKRNSSRLIL